MTDAFAPKERQIGIWIVVHKMTWCSIAGCVDNLQQSKSGNVMSRPRVDGLQMAQRQEDDRNNEMHTHQVVIRTVTFGSTENDRHGHQIWNNWSMNTKKRRSEESSAEN